MSYDNYSTEGAICPHCKHPHNAQSDNYELFSESTDVWTCHACGEDFSVALHIEHSWTTAPLED